MRHPLPNGPAALFVAHPGHELRLHHWMEIARPLVSVLTDGSGRGQSRLALTRRIVEACGCRIGPLYGRVTDQQLYRAILEGDTQDFAAMTLELAESLATNRISYLVADAWEMYNPGHDLCRVMANLAVVLAATRFAVAIANFDYPVVVSRRDSTGALSIALDETALQRKLEAGESYSELRDEVQSALQKGVASLRTERLYAVHNWKMPDSTPGTPFYEKHGEQRVATGRYTTVLRYRKHFVPFVQGMIRTLGLAESSDMVVRLQPTL